jgi:hypothetical protein
MYCEVNWAITVPIAMFVFATSKKSPTAEVAGRVTVTAVPPLQKYPCDLTADCDAVITDQTVAETGAACHVGAKPVPFDVITMPLLPALVEANLEPS